MHWCASCFKNTVPSLLSQQWAFYLRVHLFSFAFQLCVLHDLRDGMQMALQEPYQIREANNSRALVFRTNPLAIHNTEYITHAVLSSYKSYGIAVSAADKQTSPFCVPFLCLKTTWWSCGGNKQRAKECCCPCFFPPLHSQNEGLLWWVIVPLTKCFRLREDPCR